MAEIEYWYWIVFGTVLTIAEIFLPSFTVLWFGIAAIGVGVLSWFGFNPGIVWQIFIWTMLSLMQLLAWFRWLKPVALEKRTPSQAEDDFLEERGILSRVPKGEKGWGKVNFSVPINGSEVWKCKVRGNVKEGDFVKVVEVQGDTLWVAAD